MSPPARAWRARQGEAGLVFCFVYGGGAVFVSGVCGSGDGRGVLFHHNMISISK